MLITAFLNQINKLPSDKTGTVKTVPIVSSVPVNSSSVSVSSSSSARSSKPKDLFSELTQHNTTSSCWLAIQGHIYDVTPYFGSHPGGDGELQKYCGTDATAAYQSKDGQGRDHSGQAYALLQQYLIQ